MNQAALITEAKKIQRGHHAFDILFGFVCHIQIINTGDKSQGVAQFMGGHAYKIEFIGIDAVVGIEIEFKITVKLNTGITLFTMRGN